MGAWGERNTSLMLIAPFCKQFVAENYKYTSKFIVDCAFLVKVSIQDTQ